MIRYRVLPEHQLLVVRTAGKTSVEECRRFLEHVQAVHPDCVAYDSLSDVRELKTYLSHHETAAVHRAMQNLGHVQVPRRNALLVGDVAQYGVGRMFELQADPQLEAATHVVRTEREAAEWLARPLDVIASALGATDWHEFD
jgi:hypothetical protein